MNLGKVPNLIRYSGPEKFFFSIWESRLDGEVIATVRVGYSDRQQHAPADF